METGLCEVRTGERSGTYWRQGFVRYLMETGLCGLRTGERAL